MSVNSKSRELTWPVIAVLGLFALFFTVFYLRGDRDPAIQVASMAKRMEVVSAMRLALAAASEAQNSAIMSTVEQDAREFADQARSSSAALDRNRTELEQLLKERGNARELDLLARVTESLQGFQQVDKQLLDLALQNSNRKALSLAFGPAMTLLKEMDEPLARIITDHVAATSEKNIRVLQLASEVRIGVLRMQVILLPHIAEESDQKMDEFEAQLTREEKKIHQSFESLSPLIPSSDGSPFTTATTKFAEFEKLRAQIIKLSRANTDVKAVKIALNEKRKAMLACQDALVALEHAIQTEPIATLPTRR